MELYKKNTNLEKIRILHDSLFGEFSSDKIIEALPICIHEIDLDGKLIKMNKAGLCMLGETDVKGKEYLSYVSEEDKDRINKLLKETLVDGETKSFSFKSSVGTIYHSCFAPLVNNAKVVKIVGYTQENKKWII